jgi:hypothetical protein
LLPNGEVLIVGGFTDSCARRSPDCAVASAEIYEPATGRFRKVGDSLKTARGNHTATLLANGNVLLVGGASSPAGHGSVFLEGTCNRCLNSAEVFKYGEESFSEVDSKMTAPRASHFAIPVSENSIVFMGGNDTQTGMNSEIVTLTEVEQEIAKTAQADIKPAQPDIKPASEASQSSISKFFGTLLSRKK